MTKQLKFGSVNLYFSNPLDITIFDNNKIVIIIKIYTC